MLCHYLPFLVSKSVGLAEDCAGDAHFADVVQERTAAHMNRLGFAHAGGPHGHFSDPECVPLGFLVAQVERTRPAFTRFVVCQQQFKIDPRQAAKQSAVVNRNGRLTCEGVQEIQPLLVGVRDWLAPVPSCAVERGFPIRR